MKRIVILGGGYAGIHAAKILHKAFKKDKEVTVTLIEKNSYHTLMTELHEIAGNRVHEDCVRISYDRIFANKTVEVVQDTIIGLDAEKQELKSNTTTYPYDYLILGIGAETTDFGIPGVKEHALPLWGFEDAVRIKDQIQRRFRQASRERDPGKRKELLTFAVAGAGFTGIELVGELLEWFPLLCEEYAISKDEYSLITIEALPNILNMLPERLQKKAQRYMEKRGVEFILKAFISNVSEDSVTLKDGRVIECDTLIWTCGIKGRSQGREWGLEVAHVDRLRVDDTMQAAGHKNIFAVGDIHWLLEEEKPVPQIVEAAEQTAAVAAKNIIHDITGKGSESRFKSNFHGFMISIGGRYAVSHTAGISMSWIPAMALKHLVNCYYLHTVCGFNGWYKYLKREIFNIKNKRSLLGGFIAGRIQGLWAVPVRMWLGLMWLFEGINKIGEGWLYRAKGTSSAWMFSSGVVQKGMAGYGQPVNPDTVSAASEEVVETVAEVSQWKPVWNLDKMIIPSDSGFVTWFRETFMDGIAAHIDFQTFQTMIVTVECLIGLALIGGLFTFPAAGVSIIMCFVFIFSGLFSWSQVWFIFAAFLLLGGAGRTLGLDYWVLPWLKKGWNSTGLAKSTYLYADEPRFRKKQSKFKKKG